MTASRFLQVALLIAVAVLSAACGEESVESDAALEAALATDRFALDALDRYEYEVDLRLREAEFVERCMKERGFEYDGGPVGLLVEPKPLIPGVIPRPTSGDGYGLTASALAVPDEAFVAYINEVEANFRQQSGSQATQYSLALYGRTTPGPSLPDSCESQARDAVRSDQDALDALVRTANVDAWLRIEGDARIVELDDDWSRCMALAGFEFERPRHAPDWIDHRIEDVKSQGFNPQDEASMAHRRAALDGIGEEERLIASADLECRSGDAALRREIEQEYFSKVSRGLATLYQTPAT